MDFEKIFGTEKPIIGMIHLPPLPGAPKSDGDLESVVTRAVDDAAALDDGGVDAILIENFGDVPVYPDDVPKHTVASMTRIAVEITKKTDLPLGINVLRSDAEAALSVGAAAGAAFLRANIHTGARVSDQGIIEGQAHETLRLRDHLDADVGIFADRDVKHSAPLSTDSYTAESFADQTERGLADAIVVSGRGTGQPIDREYLHDVVKERSSFGLEAPIVVGSGVDRDSVAELLEVADGAIVGTGLKRDGETAAPVDRERTAELVARADEVR
ncbi:BtpA/SgcQ family protein [Halorubrum sp. CBA1125]|uniref:BtpA/SgcQ family protein n=1 Tax=Halorubrum sp. CBA1125 TaxID=2668072 RepID=UPI0012E90DA4|nr:BtpA/SgcQ family protein [Halorubrum sp. CBA1125]MUW14551.1 BtpA/SgcQ family protein [Halorubrum sp. CBA1125]